MLAPLLSMEGRFCKAVTVLNTKGRVANLPDTVKCFCHQRQPSRAAPEVCLWITFPAASLESGAGPGQPPCDRVPSQGFMPHKQPRWGLGHLGVPQVGWEAPRHWAACHLSEGSSLLLPLARNVSDALRGLLPKPRRCWVCGCRGLGA